MILFHVMLGVLVVIIGWLALAALKTFSHRGMLTMFKKVAFEWIGGMVLGLILCSGPILQFVLHR